MDPKKTAVVLIEYQNDFTSEGGTLHQAVKPVMDSTNMLANTVETVEKPRALGATIVFAPITFTERAGAAACRGWSGTPPGGRIRWAGWCWDASGRYGGAAGNGHKDRSVAGGVAARVKCTAAPDDSLRSSSRRAVRRSRPQSCEIRRGSSSNSMRGQRPDPPSIRRVHNPAGAKSGRRRFWNSELQRM
jgi:hypothetical protein